MKLLATRHAGLTMTTGELKRLYNPQARELPEPQHMIEDEVPGDLRPCLTRAENGKATRDHHQKWMGESKAEIQCLFGTLTEDEIGVNGVKIRDSAKWIKENISKGIYNYEHIDKEGQKEYLRAHEVLAPIFTTVGKPIKELQYPFFYDCETGAFSDPLVRNKFYESIAGCPGKSRDEGFTLHVLARFPEIWREGLLLFIQNILVSRCPVSSIKEMSRLPIPKGPEKLGQTRPIALVNDIYGFISAVVAIRMAEGVEMSEKLEGLK
jgi:hypothetical protein